MFCKILIIDLTKNRPSDKGGKMVSDGRFGINNELINSQTHELTNSESHKLVNSQTNKLIN